MPAMNITKENFETEVIKSDKPVLLDFYADWCGPCRTVSPLVDEIADEAADKKIGKINVDEQPELASAFKVTGIPTLAVVQGGKVINIASGAKSKAAIMQMLNF